MVYSRYPGQNRSGHVRSFYQKSRRYHTYNNSSAMSGSSRVKGATYAAPLPGSVRLPSPGLFSGAMTEGWTAIIDPNNTSHKQPRGSPFGAMSTKGAVKRVTTALSSSIRSVDDASIGASVSSASTAPRPRSAVTTSRPTDTGSVASRASISSNASKAKTATVKALTVSDILLNDDTKARIKERNDAVLAARDARLEHLRAKQRLCMQALPTSTMRTREMQEKKAAELIEKQMQLEALQKKQAEMEILLRAAALVTNKHDTEIANEKIKIIKTLQMAQRAIRSQHQDLLKQKQSQNLTNKTDI